MKGTPTSTPQGTPTSTEKGEKGTPTPSLEGTPTSFLEGTPTPSLEGTPTSPLEGTPTSDVLYEDVLPGGSHWSFTVNAGVKLRLIDVEGGGNAAMLAYNPANPLERLNLPDSLKCQHTFRLTSGHCLYSDMGRIFCSIVEDDVGWHDAASGTCNAPLVARRWGARSYQEARNDYRRNGRDCFLVELGKYGLGRRDFAANVNWFSRVDAGADGTMTFVSGHSKPGASVTLRFEMPTLVVLHTCPHPLNPAAEYPRHPIGYQLSVAEEVAEDDLCRTSREENGRGFMNNYLYTLAAERGTRSDGANSASRLELDSSGSPVPRSREPRSREMGR